MAAMSSETPSPLLARPLPLRGESELKFAAPWEARAFAIVVSLSEAGHFTWSEWVECFSREVALDAAVDAAHGQPRTYYEQWLSAAESLLAAKGLMTAEQLQAKRFAVAVAGAGNVRRWPAATP